MRYEKLKIFLSYIILVGILYYPVTFLNRSLIPSLYYPSPVMDTSFLKSRPVLPCTFLVDLPTPVYYEEPLNITVGNIIKKSEIPLWNPYIGNGIPLAAQYSSRVFFPYQILENLSPYWLWDYFILFRLVIAGFFTFLFLRKVGLSLLASFAGGILYQFSGAFTWFINLEQLTNTAMMLPILLYFIEIFINKFNFKYSFLLSVVIALVLYAGQPETAFYILILGFIYTIFRSFNLKNIKISKKIIVILNVWIVGFVFAAPLLLMFFELTLNSHHIHRLSDSMATEYITQNIYFLHNIIPGLYTKLYFLSLFPYAQPWDFTGSYVSLFFWIIIFSISFNNNISFRKEYLFFLVFGFIIIFQKFGIPPFGWIGRLPLFNIVFVPRWTSPIWTISFSIAAAIGIDNIQYIKKKNIIIVFLVLLSAIILISIDNNLFSRFLSYTRIKETDIFYSYSYVQNLIFFGSVFILYYYVISYLQIKQKRLAILMLVIIELWYYIPKGYPILWNYLVLISVSLIYCCVIFISKKKILYLFSLLGLLSYIIIEILAPAGLPLKRNPIPKMNWITHIQNNSKDFHRIVGTKRRFMPNYSGCYSLFDIRYITALTPKEYHYFVNNFLLSKPLSKYNSLWFIGSSHSKIPFYNDLIKNIKLYSWLGVRYFLSPPEIKLNFPVIYKNRYMTIYENKDYFPRTYMVFDTVYARSFKCAQKIMADSDFDLKNKAVVESKSTFKNIDAENIKWNTKIINYSANKIKIAVNAEQPGLLVLTDLYYPGWKVYVDNKPEKVLRINGLMRGVIVDSGKHIITFKYLPPTFIIGCILLLIGLFYYIILYNIKFLM